MTAFLTQNHHLDMGVVLLPRGGAGTFASLPGVKADEGDGGREVGELVPHVRFRAESYVPVPRAAAYALPAAWTRDGGKLVLEIRACNASHYAFSVGPEGRRSEMRLVMEVGNEGVSWGFTGTLLGVYATSNGGEGMTPAYFSDWRYTPLEQFRD